MSEVNPNRTLLDSNQIFQRSFDEDTDRLRVDAEVTATLGAVECIITQTSDSIAIGDGTDLYTGTTIGSNHGLDVNVISPITVSQSSLPNPDAVTKLEYNEIIGLASGSTTNIISYTVPASTTSILQKVLVSGENIAKYQILYNSAPLSTKRTYFGGNLDTEFDFSGSSNNGFLMNAGDILTVMVDNFRPTPGDFESTIQIVEVS